MVHFVGAGPGAPDLITLRGARLLEQADLVIYAGSLVNPALLDHCRADCRILDSARMTLEELLDEMERAGKAGQNVVRLHTGDPSLYGAIREQLDGLRARGVETEVVPGVSSFSAAAAALGAEYTLPGVSQSLVISRLAGRTPVPEAESLPELAAHGCSMVLFLSAGQLPHLQEQLLAGAYTEDTPAALVYKASWPEEKLLRCTLGTLAETGRAYGIDRTALVLVGSFLGEDYRRSKLYDPAFSTGYRQGEDAAKGE